MKNQLKAGILLSYATTGISIFIQLVYMPVMIRLLGQSEFGLYSLVSGVVSYLSLFSLGFTGAYLRFFARENQKNDREGLAALNGMFILLFLLLSCAALICGFTLSCFPRQIFGTKLSGAELQEARILMMILVVNTAICLVSGIFDSIVSAYEQFVFQRVVSLAATVMNPFLCLPLLLLGYGNVMLVVVSTCIVVGKLAINVWFCFWKLKIPVSFRNMQFSVLKEVGIFSFFLLLNMIIDQINWNVDKLILSHTNGTREVAVYGVASQINTLFMTFSTTISSVFSPRINRIAAENSVNSRREFTVLMAKVGRVQWMILGLMAMGFVIFGKFFIVNIYADDGYGDAYWAALFLVLPALVPLIQNAGIEIQRAMNRHQLRSIIYFIMAIANVMISIPLAAEYGVIGVTIGTMLSVLFGNGIFMNIFYHKALKLNMLFFWREILKTWKGFLLPVIVGILIKKYVQFESISTFVLFVILYAAMYCLSIFFFSCNKEEQRLIRNLLHPKKQISAH